MVISRYLGKQSYLDIWEQMKQFTLTRNDATEDELWLLEHPPVYTQGQAGKAEHILQRNGIPIVQSDRGGQVTYHGPGQLVAYVLMDIRRQNLGIRTLVCHLEKIVVAVLREYDITAEIRCGAPGVYVDNKKIASIGLRVKNGCTYHGIALNIAMDLAPFNDINPCGFAQLEMAQVSDYYAYPTVADAAEKFSALFLRQFEKQGL